MIADNSYLTFYTVKILTTIHLGRILIAHTFDSLEAWYFELRMENTKKII